MTKRRTDGADSRLLQTLRDNPTALARLVDRVGLNDAGELMALAPTRRLLQALDESLWKSPAAGAAEVFDAAALVDWLEAWNEIGDAFVAERLAAMSDDYRALCLAHLVSVGDHHTLAFLAIPDDEVDVERDTLQPSGSCAIYGPFMVAPTTEDEWEVVRASLDALWTEQPECLLRTLAVLDGAESMLAAQAARKRLSVDVAHERERHRENLGYVTPAGACAFLLFAATASIEELAGLSAYDEETRRHLAAFGASDDAANPVHAPPDDDAAEEDEAEQRDPPNAEQVQRLRTALEREQVLIPQDTLLLTDQQSGKHRALTELLGKLAGMNQAAFERCARELAYLANVLKVGVRVRGAPPTDVEARDLAYATCDRGLEVARERDIEVRIEQEPGLIRLFALGWRRRRMKSQAKA